MPQPLVPPSVSVVMATRERTALLAYYFAEGCWDGIPLHLVADGPSPGDLTRLRALAEAHPTVALDAYAEPRGAAFAKSRGIAHAAADHLIFCDDDDVMLGLPAFAHDAVRTLEDDDVLFVTTPKMFSVDERLAGHLKYDRTAFHGRTGIDVLTYLVHTGELLALMAGTAFRRTDLAPVAPDPILQVSEDFLALARLCARHPGRRVEVSGAGGYVRLRHGRSLSAPEGYTLEKAVCNLMAYAAAAALLHAFGILQERRMAAVLLEQGQRLRSVCSDGPAAAEALVAWLTDQPLHAATREAETALAFIERHAADWPDEVQHLRARGLVVAL